MENSFFPGTGTTANFDVHVPMNFGDSVNFKEFRISVHSFFHQKIKTIVVFSPNIVLPALRNSASQMEPVAILRDNVLDNAQLGKFGDGHVGKRRFRLGDVNRQLKRLLSSRVGTLSACFDGNDICQ